MPQSRKSKKANTTPSAQANTTPSEVSVQVYGWPKFGLYEAGAEYASVDFMSCMDKKHWRAILWDIPFADRKSGWHRRMAGASIRGYGFNLMNHDTGKRYPNGGGLCEAIAFLEPFFRQGAAKGGHCRTATIHFATTRFCTPERLRLYAEMFIAKISPHYDTLIAGLPRQWRGARRLAQAMGFSEGFTARNSLWLDDHQRYADCILYYRQLNGEANEERQRGQASD